MPTPIAAPPASSTFDCDFHFLVCLTEMWGLEGLDAFILAAQMKASGIGAVQAAAMFRDALERMQ